MRKYGATIALVQQLHYDWSMPTLARLASSTVTMYAADHLPPHFHVRLNDGREALVEIATLQPLTTRIAQRELADALAWAAVNQGLLVAKWKELNP